jgi:hypothetical protein
MGWEFDLSVFVAVLVDDGVSVFDLVRVSERVNGLAVGGIHNPLGDRKIAQRIVVVEQPTKEYGLVIWFYSE